ncbi:NADP oxidoreductase [Sphingobium sp. SCG-1]|nr:NAD(P)-binding domain-containing protein [Sphingobium sp. SCG-1]AUW58995.1 NADP oxidoreductase [Sphingobium sp. SCG-1]
MHIGILGTGHIGKSLVKKLSAAGHKVKVANSRSPESIDADTLSTGAQAADVDTALAGADVVILSIPLARLSALADKIAALPKDTVIIDTSNYYPGRDGTIAEIEAGMVESLWVVEQIGRTVVKAWNAIGSDSLARKGKVKGDPDRIAIPVAADSDADRAIGMALVDDTGFDGFDAGTLATSWRQQPGAPGYCTDLKADEMGPALESAEKSRLPARRDLSVAVIMERVGNSKTNPDAEFGVRVSRAIFR